MSYLLRAENVPSASRILRNCPCDPFPFISRMLNIAEFALMHTLDFSALDGKLAKL